MSSSTSRNAVILDYRTSDYERTKLEDMGIRTVESERIDTLYSAVDGHPDLQFIRYNDQLICHGGISQLKLEELKKIHPAIQKGRSQLVLPYPRHIGLNALITPDLFIHKLEATDPFLLELLKSDKNRAAVHTNQGYTRCSCAYVGKDSFVTEDVSLAKLLKGLGKSVFYAEHSNVCLRGFDYGFIGGALSLLTVRNTPLLIISGEISRYRYGDELREFLMKENIPYECIGKGLLMDRGSIIEIHENLGNQE